MPFVRVRLVVQAEPRLLLADAIAMGGDNGRNPPSGGLHDGFCLDAELSGRGIGPAVDHRAHEELHVAGLGAGGNVDRLLVGRIAERPRSRRLAPQIGRRREIDFVAEHASVAAVLASLIVESRDAVRLLHVDDQFVGALRRRPGVAGVPDAVLVAVDGIGGTLVASLLTVVAEDGPLALVDEESVRLRGDDARCQAVGFGVGTDGSALPHVDGPRVDLVFAAVDAVVDDRSLGSVGGEKGIAVAVVGEENRLADRHADASPTGEGAVGRCLRYGQYHEAERCLPELTLVSVEHIGAARRIAQGAVPGVERDDGVPLEGDFVGMPLAIARVRIDLFGPPVPYGRSHPRGCCIHQPLACVRGDRQPPHVLLVASLLRTDVVGPLLRGGAVPDAQMGGVVAVAIAVVGTAPEPCDVLRGRGHLQAEAEFRQDGSLGARCGQGAHADGSVGIDTELLADGERQGRRARLVGVGNGELHPVARRVLFHLPGAACHRQGTYAERLPAALLRLVVLGGDAEGVEFERLHDERRAVEDVARQRSAREGDGEVPPLDGPRGAGAGHGQRVRPFVPVWFEGCRLAQDGLGRCHLVASLGPGRCLAERCGEAHPVAAPGLEVDAVAGDGDGRAVPRCEVGVGNLSAGHLDAVLIYYIMCIVAAETRLLEFVLDAEGCLLLPRPFPCEGGAEEQDVDGLIDALHVEALGGRRSVGQDDAVAAEAAVVGIVAEVAAVGPVALAGLPRNGHAEPLVLPVPHELAHHGGVRLVDVAIVVYLVAHGVTHGVCVLALNVGALRSAAHTALSGGEHVGIAAVHGARHVAPLAVALVVGDAARVELFDGLHHALKVVAAATFVASAPAEDADVVAKCAHLAFVAFHHRLAEQLHAAEARVPVAFHVGFCQDVEAVLVAQLVEVRIVGIVTGAHGVDVEALHGEHVLQHLFAAHRAARLLAEVVAVHAMDHEATAVDEQGAVAPDADRAEAYLAGSHVDELAVGREQPDGQVVELGMFSAPTFDAGEGDGLRDACRRGERLGVLFDGVGAVADCHLQLHAPQRTAAERDLQASLSRRAGGGERRGVVEEVGDVLLGGRPQIDVAGDTRQAPVVLALEEGAAREAKDLHGDVVLALADEVRHVEVAGQVGVLGIACELAVHPDVIAVARTVETQEGAASQPAFGQGERAAVAAHGVLHLLVVGIVVGASGHHGVVAGVGEGVAGVDVEGFVPRLAVPDAIHLPGRGDCDVVPGSGIVAVGMETRRHLAWQSAPAELPRAVQVEEVRRAAQVERVCSLGITEGDAEVVARGTVQARHAYVVPLFHRLCRRSQRSEAQAKQ